MEYRFLGRSGLKVSVLSLGGWVTYGGQVGDDIAEQCLKEAYDVSFKAFNLVEVYNISYANGKSEIAMGNAIKKFGWKRSSYVISTKIFRGGEGRLQLDYVDLIFAHRPDVDTPTEEIVRAFNWVIEKGWALHWGTSEWSAEQLTDAHRIAEKLGLIGPLMEQPQYNMFHRERFEKEYAPCMRNGLGTTIWSPLASGEIPADSRFALKENPIMQNLAAGLAKVDKLKPIADKLGYSLAQLALAWCIKNPNVSTVITGLEVVPKLTPEVLEEIEAILVNKPEAALKFR
ncbi:Aldo/keto reductase [Rhizoclosmatium globosum]|uniref:Aldo/keto reductase n=1 Tax=Rhizoclosmatium globosum TaxID=329046 RepID=A0A1Y2CHR6_9FUNG|nr:Aldo/keto reductase [Rhizoclosmatium globosum]|eukprot:ORY46457.1 Aldo/keto reductase [Rhizoclosmatium globosum]